MVIPIFLAGVLSSWEQAMKLWEKLVLGVALSIVIIRHKIKEIFCRENPNMEQKEDSSENK